jgi:2'-5' RNA ligase
MPLHYNRVRVRPYRTQGQGVPKVEYQTMPRYVLLVRVPREVEVRIEDTFLSVIGATKSSMGYHLSLLGPYYLAEGQSSPFLPAIARVCRTHGPFTLRLAGLGTFRTANNNAVYLGVTNPEPIIELHAALLEATAQFTVPQNAQMRIWTVDNYLPHVTLGLGMDDGDLEEFLRAGISRDVDATFVVNSIWLAAQAPNGPWEYVAEYPLGTTVAQSQSRY